MSSLVHSLRVFSRNQRGNVAMILALAILPMGMFVGAAMDFNRHQTNSVELSASLDASALAAARYVIDNPGVEQADVVDFATTYLQANFLTSDTKKLNDINIEYVENDYIRLTASSEIDATMLSLAGINTLKTDESAKASFGTPSALRAVLVLDGSSSMQGTKMTALQEAAQDFVTALTESNTSNSASTNTTGASSAKFGGLPAAAAATSAADNSAVASSAGNANSYIGIVPFSHYVNVGTDKKHASWIDVPNKKSKIGKSCSTDGDATRAAGCVLETKKCTRTNDGVKYESTCSKWVCPPGTKVIQTCKNVSKTRDWCGAVVSRPPPYNMMDADYGPEPVEGYLTQAGSESWECGSPILPMTSNANTLETYIDNLDANGDTYIAPGLMWGYRVLSPGAPFTEMAGKDINSSAIVLMSDGMNSRSYKSWSTGSDHYGSDKEAANEDTLAACEFIKSKNVDIYAIAFQIDDKDTEDMLKTCATSYSHFYDADSIEKLKTAFADVAASFREIALTE